MSKEMARALGAEGITEVVIAGKKCVARPLTAPELTVVERDCVERYRRSYIKTFVDNAAAAVDTFADDLSALGRPDVPSGEEIQSSLQTATDDARQAFDDARNDLDEEIDSATDVATAAGAIAQATQQALTAIGQATSNLQELDDDGTLRAELEDAAECVGLGS